MFTNFVQAKKLVNVPILIICGIFFTAFIAIRALVGFQFIWDEAWYESITTFGYNYVIGGQSSIAFFPLFPLLIKVISLNGLLPIRLVALLVNFAAVYGICYFALALANKLHPGTLLRFHKLFIILGIILFPASFFFVSFYADALLVFFITAAIFYAFDKNYLLAFAFSGLATATKFTGITAVLTCLFIYWSHEKPKNFLHFAGYLLLGASGLVLYMGYLWANFGNPFIFISAQQEWGRNGSIFIISLVNESTSIFKDFFNSVVSKSYEFVRLLNIAMVGGSILVSYFAVRKKQYWLVILIAAAIGVPILSGSFGSIVRYALVALPALLAYFVPKIIPSKKNSIILAGVVCAGFIIEAILYFYFAKGSVFIA